MAVIEDVAPALLEQLQQDFRSRVQDNRKLQDLLKLVNDGKATYIQAEELACEMGKALSQTFGNCLSSAVLPDGKMYFNIAQRVVAPMLREDHQLIAQATEQVQTALNKKAGIGLKPQTVAVDEDRIYGIVNKISEAEIYDDVAWVLGEPVVNFSQSVVDSILKANVDFQGKAGLTPKIYRKAERKCCKWCRGLVGVYDYPMVPDDVYRRHERCRCIVDYDPGDGRRQNVHTKQWKNAADRDKIKQRKSLKSSTKRINDKMLHTVGDPMLEVDGPGELSHPQEIAAFRKEIQDCGADLIEKEHEDLGYCPGLFLGQPGQVHVSKGASYSAWCHEVKHMRDDREAGWQGMRIMQDKDARYERERAAYNVEIELAEAAGRPDIVKRLKDNLEKERRAIYGDR